MEMIFLRPKMLSAARAFLPRDARVFQILFLALLLTVGVLLRDFSLQPLQMALAFAAGLATQAFWLKRLGLGQRGFLSAIVTCCGLSLLLRSDTMWAHPLAAALAMSSKFLLRLRGKHLYNPANLGVIAAIALIPGTWVSPGQWGNDLALAVWVLMLGTIVTTRARRLDVSWMFLGAFLGLVALRIMLLGQLWATWWHQLGNGALLLFAFFMISDPMTTPNRRGPRIAYALIVAAAAIAWQYVLFRPNALIWALFLATPLVPLLDRLFPGEGFSWRGREPASEQPNPLRAFATSGIPSTTVAEGWPVPARNATTASSSCPAPPSPTSDAPSSRRARPVARDP
jgi:Na+-transporting NADH:ubiquinone oxidoreductase subunit NqrB